MKYKCIKAQCNANGVWGGCLPSPCAFGGSIKDCANRYAVSRTEQECENMTHIELHAASKPSGLLAIADGIEGVFGEQLIEALAGDSLNSEWIRKWITTEAIPALAASVESLRIAAHALKSKE